MNCKFWVADLTFLYLLAHIFVASQILHEHKPCRLSPRFWWNMSYTFRCLFFTEMFSNFPEALLHFFFCDLNYRCVVFFNVCSQRQQTLTDERRYLCLFRTAALATFFSYPDLLLFFYPRKRTLVSFLDSCGTLEVLWFSGVNFFYRKVVLYSIVYTRSFYLHLRFEQSTHSCQT